MSQEQDPLIASSARITSGGEIFSAIQNFRRERQDDPDFSIQYSEYLLSLIHGLVRDLGLAKEQLWLTNKSIGEARAKTLKSTLTEQRDKLHLQELQAEVDCEKRDNVLQQELSELQAEEEFLLCGSFVSTNRPVESEPQNLAEFDAEVKRYLDEIHGNYRSWLETRDRLLTQRMKICIKIQNIPSYLSAEDYDQEIAALFFSNTYNDSSASNSMDVEENSTQAGESGTGPHKQASEFEIHVDQTDHSSTKDGSGNTSSSENKVCNQSDALSSSEQETETEVIQEEEDIEEDSNSPGTADDAIPFNVPLVTSEDKAADVTKVSEVVGRNENRPIGSRPPHAQPFPGIPLILDAKKMYSETVTIAGQEFSVYPFPNAMQRMLGHYVNHGIRKNDSHPAKQDPLKRSAPVEDEPSNESFYGPKSVAEDDESQQHLSKKLCRANSEDA